MKKVAIVGAPGAGKSTLQAGLYYFLKAKGINVDMIPELIKYSVYNNDNFDEFGFDVKNLIKQKALEDIFINANPPLDIILTEAPLCVASFYAEFYKRKESMMFTREMANNSYYDKWIYVRLNPKLHYESFGRNEDQADSKKVEDLISDYVLSKDHVLTCYCNDDIHEIVDWVLE